MSPLRAACSNSSMRRLKSAFARANSDDQLVALVRALAADRRSLPRRSAGHDPQAMRLTSETKEAAVVERSELRQLLGLAGLPVQVPPQPRLALGHERFGQPLGVTFRASRPRRDRHQRRVPGIHREAEVARPNRTPDRAFEPPARQPERGAPFGRRRRHCAKSTAGDTPRARRGRARPRGRRRPSQAQRLARGEAVGAFRPPNDLRAAAPG